MPINSIQRLNLLEAKLTAREIIKEAYPVFLKNTPIDTGNARKKTQRRDESIVANYPYAQVLEQGRSYRDGQMRGSDQAPQGMSKPTIEHIRQWISKQGK